MSKMVNSFAELESAISRDLASAMTGARNEVKEKLEDNVMDYYSQGSPKIYKRTGTLLTSPEATPVSGGGNLRLIWMNQSVTQQAHIVVLK